MIVLHAAFGTFLKKIHKNELKFQILSPYLLLLLFIFFTNVYYYFYIEILMSKQILI